jgi:hypothetical protein
MPLHILTNQGVAPVPQIVAPQIVFTTGSAGSEPESAGGSFHPSDH